MASSGSKSVAFTSWNSLVFSWEIDSQSIENNTSTVYWKLDLVAGSSGRIDSSVYKTATVTVNGETRTKNVLISTPNNYTTTLFEGQTVITHDATGSKTFSYSVSQPIDITFSGNYIGTLKFSGTGTLDSIPRHSTISVTSGNLGQAQTITVTRKNSSFKHTITYKCGSLSGTICSNSSNTSISFTPPLSLAAANTTGQSVNVTYTITTINGNITLPGTKSVTVTHKMLATNFAPSVSISASDPNGHKGTYGSYVKGLSKFGVTVTATPKYSASISTYSSTANGATYTSASFTTELLKTSGTLQITATVKDSRGFTGTATTSVTVLDYTPPSVSKLTVHRCNSDGTENNQGEYVKATFSAAVTPLNDKNTATYTLRYKKSSDTSYTSYSPSGWNNIYTIDEWFLTFPAATDSSYDVELEVTDNHSTTKRATSASTAFTLLHFRSDGTGIGFGKISEYANTFDFGLPLRMSGGITSPLLVPETDLNEVRTPNTYTGENVSTYNYLNCPVTNGTFTLLVESCGDDGQVKQTFVTCSKYKPEKYARFYYQGEWGAWCWASTDEVVLYDNPSGTNGTIPLTYSASHFRYLDIYFTDNNGKNGGYTKVYSPNGKSVCLHIQEPSSTIYSRQTLYNISGTSMTPDVANASNVRFSGTSFLITSGTNYIKVVRVIGRA